MQSTVQRNSWTSIHQCREAVKVDVKRNIRDYRWTDADSLPSTLGRFDSSARLECWTAQPTPRSQRTNPASIHFASLIQPWCSGAMPHGWRWSVYVPFQCEVCSLVGRLSICDCATSTTRASQRRSHLPRGFCLLFGQYWSCWRGSLSLKTVYYFHHTGHLCIRL